MDVISALQRIVGSAQQRNAEGTQPSSHEDAGSQMQALLQNIRNCQSIQQTASTTQKQQMQVDTECLLSQLSQLNQILGNQQASKSHQTQQQRHQAMASVAVNNHLLGQHLGALRAHTQQPPAVAQNTGSSQPQQHAFSLPPRTDSRNGEQHAALQADQQACMQSQQQIPEQQKKRRGRPASAASKTHPNLVYVRRFRERQKQMESELEATVAEKRRQLERLELEQRQLCTRWEALEQVLHVQTGVLQLMQNLSIRDQQTPAEQQLQLLNPERSPDTIVVEQDGSPESSEEAKQHADAVSFATAAIRLSEQPNAELDLLKDKKLLLLQARNWLEPVRLYALRAALMLEQLNLLPKTAAAEAALIAARSCPHAGSSAKVHSGPQATADAITAAIKAAIAEGGPAAAATAAAAVAAAVRSAWDGSCSLLDGHDQRGADGVPLVRYPYSIGMYVITPPPIKDLVWPMNMDTWQIDDGNNQQHAESAARAMWAVMAPERWRLLKATWLTMSRQMQQVQQDFARLHEQLRRVGARRAAAAPNGDVSAGAHKTTAAGVEAADAADGVCEVDRSSKAEHGPSLSGFTSMEESTAYEYAAAAVEIENVLMREDAISFQLCGAFLDLVDPIELAVGYVSSWPYHPQAFTIQDVLFKLGEPPEQAPTADTKA